VRGIFLSVTALAVMMMGGSAFAQQRASDAALRYIHEGNQAWVNGMKSGDAAKIAMTYAADALDCGATGECVKGRAAIERAMQQRVAKIGRADSASVMSLGSVQRGNFVYEWGSATAGFANGKKIEGSYLTVWQKQKDGSWKIFRNMALP
jgi:ketosteroid isomerase-like protein